MSPPWFCKLTFAALASVLGTGAAADVGLGSVAGIVVELPPQAANKARPTMGIEVAAIENNFMAGYLIPRPGQRVHSFCAVWGNLDQAGSENGWQ